MAYTVIEEIGEGGFGVVQKVTDDAGVLWAKKSFKNPNLPDIDPAQIQKRFEREVRYQSKFSHPNIVHIVDFDLATDPPFFIMELAECSLLDELRADHTLGGAPNKALFDILAGLEAIHTLGITHRDLKPGNVLKFEEEDGSARYAISDFGLMTANESQTTTLTQSNLAGGTADYAAPECVTNFKRAMPLSDIYSFGAILHDIFVGTVRVPYSELSGPEPIGTIISTATKSNPLRRYSSVADLRVELYEVLSVGDLVFSSDEEEKIIDLLKNDNTLDDEHWDRVFLFLEENENDNQAIGNIFRYVSYNHIQTLHDTVPALFTGMGRAFCSYVQNGTFNFDYCDVLASKIERFFMLGDTDIKAMAIVALLAMGVSHNRWFVEHKFMSFAAPDLSDEVAQRVQIEIEIQELDFDRLVSHVERSIEASRGNLHPIFQDMLAED